MRKVKVPLEDILAWAKNPVGRCLCFPVKVNWAELQLTPDQELANSIAYIDGEEIPYPDNSIFDVVIYPGLTRGEEVVPA